MKKSKRYLTLEKRQELYGFVFISPWIIGFILTFLTPLVSSVLFSFSKVNINRAGYNLSDFGLTNYKTALFGDSTFPKAITSSLSDIFYNVPVIIVFSFFVALLLKEKFKGVKAVKSIFFLPVIMSSGLFVLLQSNFGQVTVSNLDATMQNAGQSVKFLESVNLANYLLDAGIPSSWIDIITAPIDRIYSVISSSGIQIFIFLAGLNSISPSLYEACYVEGGTGWETFWKITFPMMTPLILVNIIYSIVDTFTAITNSVMTYVYEIAFQKMEFGLSNAMSWIYFLILGIIMLIVMWVVSKRVFYYT